MPTVVIGSAERTDKSSAAWVLTLLHEHFHQWQYSQPGYYEGVARLDLARGDTTGKWMLDYAFPYDSVPVQRAVRRLATALGQALDAAPSGKAEALRVVVDAREALRGLLTGADYRYFEFQMWQEGVARFIEYAAARAAAEALRSLRRELERLALGHQRRVAFYPLGAAMALLLEETRSNWKRAYADRPFALAALLSTPR